MSKICCHALSICEEGIETFNTIRENLDKVSNPIVAYYDLSKEDRDFFVGLYNPEYIFRITCLQKPNGLFHMFIFFKKEKEVFNEKGAQFELLNTGNILSKIEDSIRVPEMTYAKRLWMERIIMIVLAFIGLTIFGFLTIK